MILDRRITALLDRHFSTHLDNRPASGWENMQHASNAMAIDIENEDRGKKLKKGYM